MQISERPGVCQELGTRLIQQQEKLFDLWHRVRDGTLTRGEFVELASYIRREIVSHLQQTADYEIASKEKTPLAKTVRTCRQLLKVESAMWSFVTSPGVEPTNNAAERAIRPAVRKAAYQFWLPNKSRKYFCRTNANCSDHTKIATTQYLGVDHDCCCQ